LPATAFDDRPVLGVWFNDRAVVRVPEMAAWFNELAARAGLHVGMVCGTDYFDIWETERGACDYAELTDRGPVGQFLRVLRQYGGFSPKASLGEHALSVRWMIEENNEAVAEANDRVLRLAPPERRPVSEIARRCEHVLDFLIEPLIAHRDIPVGAPKFIHGPLRRRQSQ
jgi:hypothetical protein